MYFEKTNMLEVICLKFFCFCLREYIVHYKSSKMWTRSVPEAYSESCRKSKMKRVAEIVNGFYLLTIFVKCSILDVCLTGFWIRLCAQ